MKKQHRENRPQRSDRRKTKMGRILVILAAALCLAGCGAGQNSAGAGQNSAEAGKAAAVNGLSKDEMGRLCYYRDERDENFDADMEIVEGRIDALTDGIYLKEETELETESGSLDAVNFYVPVEAYKERSLRDISRILINRPMNLWLSNDNSSDANNYFGEKIALPREALESVELLEGCPDFYNPRDFGLKEDSFTYLKMTLTEEYSRENPQIWEWEQPYILQDIEGFEGYAHIRVYTDAESRCMICVESKERKGTCKSLYYSYTHEPLSDGFYLLSLPAIEWESGDEMKGAGQIEADEFETDTVINEYAPKETYVSDKNWEQTLQAIRERLDATGIPYALGHRPEDVLTIAIRMEHNVFSENFMDDAVKNSEISFSALGESITETPGSMKAEAVSVDSQKSHLALDMSALRKETFYKLSQDCVKAGGGRIVLSINDKTAAYGDCNEIIRNGKFVMTHNAFTAEEGFTEPMEWLPDYLAAVVGGTPIPMVSSYSAAVTLKNSEQAYLTREGQLWIPNMKRIPREKLYDVLRSKVGDLNIAQIGILAGGTPCIQYVMPEGSEEKSRNAQIAEIMSRTYKALQEEFYTYWMRIDFVDESGMSVIRFTNGRTRNGDISKINTMMFAYPPITQEDQKEVLKLLTEDERIADLVTVQQ